MDIWYVQPSEPDGSSTYQILANKLKKIVLIGSLLYFWLGLKVLVLKLRTVPYCSQFWFSKINQINGSRIDQ